MEKMNAKSKMTIKSGLWALVLTGIVLVMLACQVMVADAAPAWTQKGTNGFGNSNNTFINTPDTYDHFGGQLYAGTQNYAEGGEMWRSPDGSTWTTVTVGGFDGDSDNVAIGPANIYYGYLYGWSHNTTDSAEIWRSADGSTWTKASSLGNPAGGGGAWTGILFKDQVYAASWGVSGGGKIWRTNDGTTWNQVNAAGFGNPARTKTGAKNVWKGYLYADGGGGAGGLFRTANGTDWNELTINGDSANTNGVQNVTGFQGSLYVANRSGDIWRSSDLSSWTTATATGFGDPNNEIAEGTLRNVNGQLYISTENPNGSQIWQTADGTSWVDATPGWDSNNKNSRHPTTFKGKLYIGTRNWADGGELWAYDFDNTPIGLNVSPDIGNDATITFSSVSTTGSTVVTLENWTAPAGPPAGYSFLESFYDLSTDVLYSGDITVTVPFDETEVTGDEEDLELFHWNGSSWDVVSSNVDTGGNTITGQVSSLSIFASGLSTSVTVPVTTLETSPTIPDGLNGWFKAAPTINLTRNEPGTTFAQWDSTSPAGFEAQDSTLAPEGKHTIYYFSVDTDGNTETVNNQIIKVNTTDWEQVSSDGFGDKENGFVFPWEVFNGQIYTGTLNTVTGGEIWRSTNGTFWTQANTSGFGNSNNFLTLPRLVANGYLYAMTENPIDGTEFWRTSNGTSWSQTSSFNDASIAGGGPELVFNGNIYAGSWGATNGVKVWRSPASDGATWTQVNVDGFGDSSNTGGGPSAEFNGYLYANVGGSTVGQIWRTPDGTTWTTATAPGFGDPVNGQLNNLTVFKGNLYASASGNASGTQIWRTPDGTNWSQAMSGGFGDANNSNISANGIYSFGGNLYVGTKNGVTGTEIWRSSDGTTWEQINTDGFGDPDNIWSRHWIEKDGTLYVGTRNNVSGGAVWSLDVAPETTLETSPTPADGDNGWFKTQPTINLTRNEPGTTYMQFAETTPTYADPNWVVSDTTSGPVGINTLFYFSVDTANNTETINSRSLKIDNQPPVTFTQIMPLADTTANALYPLFSWNDSTDTVSGLAKYQLYIDGSLNSTDVVGWNAAVPSSALSNGAHTWFVRAFDNAGNYRDSTTQNLTVNVEPGQITFNSGGEVYVMNTDGTGQVNVSNNIAYDQEPVFNSDGSKIIFNSTRDGNYEIYVMDSDGSDQTRITNNVANDFGVFSPDGSKISFGTNRDGNWEVYIMSSDGTGQINLTNTSPASEWNPAFSPDGSKIAFESGSGGMYVMNSDGSSRTMLTSNGAAPDFSPDGSKIAFESYRDGNAEIYIMNSDGTGQTRLTNNVAGDYAPVLSPDGSKIVFMSIRDGDYEIYVMNADGSGQVKLTDNAVGDYLPDWGSGTAVDGAPPITSISTSPTSTDGDNGWFKTVPTVSLTRNEPGTTYMQWDSTAPAGFAAEETTIASEGDHAIYYFSVDTAGNTETVKNQSIKVDRSDPTDPTLSSPSHTISTTSTTSVVTVDLSGATDTPSGVEGFSITWSEDNSQTPPQTMNTSASVSSTTSAPLADGTWWVNVSTKDYAGNWTSTAHMGPFVIDGPGDQLTTNMAWDNHADWSPDGTKIVFESDRSGNPDIWVMNDDGSSQVQLTTDTAFDRRPYFSPDGTKIVYHSDRSGNHDVWVMNSDGTGETQITTDLAGDEHPTWSHDGTKIVFESLRTGNSEIWVMDSSGTSQTQITTNTADDWHPFWSPDGEKVSFQSMRSGNPDIWVMDPDGSNQVQLTTDTAVESHANWSPDSAKIAFRSERTGNLEVWTMNADGSNQTQLTPNLANDWAPDWSPDATKMAFNSDRSGNADIWVLGLPPTTTLETSPTPADGDNGWFKTVPTVSLTRNEPGTTYAQWDSTSPAGFEAQDSTLAPEGNHTIYYYSVDTAGNTETVNNQSIKVDTSNPTDPTLISPSHTISTTSTTNVVTIDLSGATDTPSGIEGFSISWSEDTSETPPQTMNTSASVSTTTSAPLSDGTWWVNVRTKDYAGRWTSTAHMGPFIIETAAPAIPEVAFIKENMGNGVQRLLIHDTPTTVPGDIGPPIATDWWIGDTDTNMNITHMASGDFNGDTIPEVVFVTEKLTGGQSLLIFETPTIVGGNLGSPIATDWWIGDIGGNMNVTHMTVGDFDGDTTPEIALVVKHSVTNVQGLLIYEAPVTVGGNLGSPIIIDWWIGDTDINMNITHMTSGDFYGDTASDLAFIIENKITGVQSLIVYETTVGNPLASSVITDWWIGDTDTNMNITHMTSGDFYGDSTSELALIRENATTGVQSLFIHETPPSGSGNLGPAVITDPSIGTTGTNSGVIHFTSLE